MDYSMLCALGLNSVLDDEIQSLKKSRLYYFVYILGFGIILALLGNTFYRTGTSHTGLSKYLFYCLAGILFFGVLTCVFLFVKTFFLFKEDFEKIEFIKEKEYYFQSYHAFVAFRHYQMSTILHCIANWLDRPTVKIDDTEIPAFCKFKDEDFIATSTIWQIILLKRLAAKNAVIYDHENSRTIGIRITEDYDIRIILISEEDEISELLLREREDANYSSLLSNFLNNPNPEHTFHASDFHSHDEQSIYSYLENDFHFIPS